MVTFQGDFLLTINNNNDIYQEKINELFTKKDITSELTITEAEKMIEYLKEFKKLNKDMCQTIDKMMDLKKNTDINNKIEKELMLKILPIMNVYRTLLYEKYNTKNNIEDID